MSFVLFKNDGRRILTPRVSITKGGVIGFNNGSVRRFNLSKYKKCLLYYDNEEMKIAIELLIDDNNPVSVALRHKLSSSAEITCRKFFNFFEIIPKSLIIFEPEAGEKDNTIILDMKKGIIVRNRTRVKSQEN